MDRILADHPYLAWIVVAAAVATAVGVLWRKAARPALRWAVRTGRRVDSVLDGLLGEPARDGRAAVPSLMDRTAAIEKMLTDHGGRLTKIEHELRPNSGLSLRDAVDRVEQAVTDQPG